MLKWIIWNRIVLEFKLSTYTKLDCLKMDQIELNCALMLNWIVWNRTVYKYKTDLALNNLQWLLCHETKSNKNSVSSNAKQCFGLASHRWPWEMHESVSSRPSSSKIVEKTGQPVKGKEKLYNQTIYQHDRVMHRVGVTKTKELESLRLSDVVFSLVLLSPGIDPNTKLPSSLPFPYILSVSWRGIFAACATDNLAYNID